MSSTGGMDDVAQDRADEGRGDAGPGGVGSADAAVVRGFLRRARRIDCPREGCPGEIATEDREVVRSLGAGAGATVVLRCSIHPDDHSHSIRIRRFDPEEQAELVEVLRSGRRPPCPRCESELDLLKVKVRGGAGNASIYSCGWCGVRWSPRGDIRGLMR